MKRSRPRRLRPAHRRGLVPSVALVAGIVAVTLLVYRPAPAKAPDPVLMTVNNDDVVLLPTPNRAVARGERLADVPTTLIQWPRTRVLGEYVRDAATLKNAIARTPLPRFLPIPSSALATSRLDENQVVEGIPAGMRAITVRVDAESAVEGWAQSGNFVDVILVRIARDSGAGLESTVIAENVRILSAGRSAEPAQADQYAPKTPTTVTLLTSQEDSLKIKTAANMGKLTFALRGTNDQGAVVTTRMDQRSILGGAAQPLPSAKDFRGYAKDASGAEYVLANGSRWVRSHGAPGPFGAVSTTTTTTGPASGAAPNSTGPNQP